jgi:hypothetical protein
MAHKQKMNRHVKNKLSTPSYFIKRLKDSKLTVLKLFGKYSDADPRKWTVIVDPGKTSVFITCYENKVLGEVKFEISDGGNLIRDNYFIVTESAEIIVMKLLELGIQQRDD